MAGNKPHSLKLLEVDLGWGWAGGQSQSFALALGMASRGHEVCFICRSGSELARRLVGEPVECIEMPVRGRWDLAAILRLGRSFRDSEAQIIHTHDSLSFWLAGLAKKLSRTRAPLIAHKRTDHPPGRRASLRYRRLADQVIAISRAAQEVLTTAGLPAEKVTLIYSSVDCEWFKPDCGELAAQFMAEHNLGEEGAVVGTIGSLVPRKGQAVFLHAAKEVLAVFPNARFIICGHGPLELELREQARQLEIADCVIFLDERADVRPLLASMDCFVLPSLAEGLGVAALEAMAMGKPVVASRVGGLAEVVEDNCTGFLVEPGRPEALAEALLRLLRDNELRATLGRNARQRALARFDRKIMVSRTEELYYSLLAAH